MNAIRWSNLSFIKQLLGRWYKKWDAFLRVDPAPIFFLPLLLLVVADFHSDNFINNNGATNEFILFVPWDGNDK